MGFLGAKRLIVFYPGQKSGQEKLAFMKENISNITVVVRRKIGLY